MSKKKTYNTKTTKKSVKINNKYIIFILVVLIALLFSNKLIAMIFSNQFPVREISEDELKYKDDVYKYILFTNPMGNVLEEFNIDGWALCATEEPNDSKEIDVILKSDQHIYSISTELSERNDVKELYKDINNNSNHGFGCVFSTLNIKDGIYDLLIQDIENEYNYGVVNTGVQLIKDNKGMRKYDIDSEYMSESVDLNKDSDNSDIINNDIICELGSDINIDNGALELEGWAVLTGCESKGQNVYVEVYDEDKNLIDTLSTMKFNRSDVSSYLKNEMYLNSGFKLRTDSGNIDEEGVIFRIIIEDDGNLYYSNYIARKPLNFDIEDGKIELENINLNKKSDNVQICFENSMPVEDDCVVIGGWAFVEDMDALDQNVYIYILDDNNEVSFFDTYQYDRRGVVSKYNDNRYLNSGFKSKIPLELLPDGEFTVGIVIENNGNFYVPESTVKIDVK